jgi:hypothetical protein
MPWADLSEGLSGLRRWSKPVIYDRLIAAYRKLISDHELARNLTRLHARVWRALIRGDMAEFEEMRETLVGALEPCDLTLDHLAEVDGDIMIELLDVVMARYNRSHRTARAYHLALMDLAGRLRPMRLAA